VIRIIQALWLGWMIYWFISAFHNKRTIYRQRMWPRLLFLVVLIAIFYIIGYILGNSEMLHTVFFRITLFTQIFGIALCAAGLAMAVWARVFLGKNWSSTPTIKENHELIQGGPYVIVRHPIYCGIIIAFLGMILAITPTPVGLIDLGVLIVALFIKSRTEEKLMIQQFPEQYPEYKNRVRGGLLPFIL
jgi:protein-S-isoprenylcysteine O-methyltransferase Ste14